MLIGLRSCIARILPNMPMAGARMIAHAGNIPSNLATRDIESLLHPYTNLATFRETGPLIIERGQGIHLYDTAGRGYIDGMAGLWCTALGWGNEELAETAAAQMRKLAFGHLFGGKSHDGAIELAEKLKEIAPVPTSKVFFCNSGSEANDTQIKLIWYMNNALGRPRKKKIISRRKGYHGVTIAAASLTGLPVNQTDFDVPIANILHTVLSASLSLRAGRRERGGVRDAARRRARRADPAGRAGHRRRLLRRAGDGGGRRDRSAGDLFRQGAGGLREVRRLRRLRRGDLRLRPARHPVRLPGVRIRAAFDHGRQGADLGLRADGGADGAGGHVSGDARPEPQDRQPSGTASPIPAIRWRRRWRSRRWRSTSASGWWRRRRR